MRENARSMQAGWLPLRDSYEESVLTWYEQVENSFRRREQDALRPAATSTKGDEEPPRPVYE